MFIKAAEDLCINGVQYKTNQCKKIIAQLLNVAR
jgi:hypothetical protein